MAKKRRKSQKGGQWERETSRELSLWWTSGEDDDLFWRSSQSGGRATTRARKGKTTSGHCGDLSATDTRGVPLMNLITFELKRGYGSSLADILDYDKKRKNGGIQEYERWIIQASDAADRARTPYWMLMFRRDFRSTFCIYPKELDSLLTERNPGLKKVIPRLELRTRARHRDGDNTIRRGNRFHLVGMRFEDWMEHVHPRTIRKIVKQRKREQDE